MKTQNIGILDPTGTNDNPLTNKPYSDSYRELAKKWSNLPAYKKSSEIIDSIKNNQVTLIISSTGSGKTVLINKFMLHSFDYKNKVITTLPKQLTTKSAAEYAAKMMDVELGVDVSYQYKGSDSQYKNKDSRLLYATDGSVIAMLLKDPLLSNYGGVCIDEAHERKVTIDFLLYLLKNTIKKRPDFKLVIMSATINQQLFESYFLDYKYKTIDVGGERSYPIESIFLTKSIESDYTTVGYGIIKQILNSDDSTKPGAHDIIFFITSVMEATKICEMITKDNLDIYCIEVYSGMNADQEQLALDIDKYKLVSNKGRKLIMATGVAESSMTFPGIKYVIDSGYELNGSYDPIMDAKILQKQYITKAQASQRMGRAGRMEPGICYHLYTKDDHSKMKDYPEPSIRTSDIYQECLKLLNYEGINSIENLVDVFLQFIEPPRKDYIISAINKLQLLGLVDDKAITKLGNLIADTQIDPCIGLAMYNGRRAQCFYEVITIISLIEACKNNMSELFRNPKDMNINEKRKNDLEKKFKQSQSQLKSIYGDYAVIYKIMQRYLNYVSTNSSDKINDFSYKYFINTDALKKAKIIFDKYNKFARKLKPDLLTVQSDPVTKALGCIYRSYTNHIATHGRSGYSNELMSNVPINKSSFVNYLSQTPKYICYQELFISGNRKELNIVGVLTNEVDGIIKILKNNIHKN